MSAAITPAPSQPAPRDWLSVILLGLVWGATFMVIALALEGYGPLTVAAARTTLGAATLGLTAALLRRPFPAPTPRLVAHLAVIGLFSTAVPFFLLSWGQTAVPSAFAGLSMATVPLFVLPLAHLFVPGERLSWRKAGGFMLGFLGAAVLAGPEAFTGGAAALPHLACIAAALCYAVSSIATRRCPPVDPVMLAALSLLIGAGAILPVMLWVEGLPGAAPPRPMVAILALGLVPTALAALIRVQVIRRAGPSFMTLTNYQVPIWSMLFGSAVLGETLAPRFYVALACILAGLAISQRRRRG